MSEIIYCVRCAGEGKDVPARRHVFHLTHFSNTGEGPSGRYALDLCNRHSEDFWGLFKPYVEPSEHCEVPADDLDVWLPEIGKWYGPYKRWRALKYARPVRIEPGMLRAKGEAEPHAVRWVYYQSNYSYEGNIERRVLTTFIKLFGKRAVPECEIEPRYDLKRREE